VPQVCSVTSASLAGREPPDRPSRSNWSPKSAISTRRTQARLGVDPSTLDLLGVIRRAGPPYELTTREISRRSLITPGAVSHLVARAELSGLVER
jgi:DNA-binding MarR family transcriptional regulator